MGKTKIKTIDLSQPEEEKKKKQVKAVKSEHNKAVGAVEHTEEPKIVEEAGAKQAHSESIGETSGALVSDEQIVKEEQQELQTQPSEQSQKPDKSAGPRTPQAKKVRSKKYQEASKLIDPNQKYPLDEAVKLAQQTSYSKFPGTVEAHLNTNAKNLRGLVSLPFGAGKKLKVLAFGKGASESGADLVGTDETIAEIEKGQINFDIIVTTPDWMSKLARAAKVLGPKGLMPNPKNGTITDNLVKTVAEMQGGKTEYRTESAGQVIHLAIGKTIQEPTEISANIKTLYNTIGKSKIKKITLASSMGPGVKVDLASI